MKMETKVTGSVVVPIPPGIFLHVPSMGTRPGQMTILSQGPTEGEVLRKLDKFYEAVAQAIYAAREVEP